MVLLLAWWLTLRQLFIFDFCRTVVVNVLALSGLFSPNCVFVWFMFSLLYDLIVLRQVLCSYYSALCFAMMWDVQLRCNLPGDAIQLAPGI